MDTPVPPEITSELTQILSNLVLGDNVIRSNAEKAVDERLAQRPDAYLLALAHFALSADTEVISSFSLVLLRRFLFRHTSTNALTKLTLYDTLSTPTLESLERLLLHTLTNSPSPVVRSKAVSTVSDVANAGMARGRPWHALQSQVFTMCSDASNESMRESAFKIFASSTNLIMDLQTGGVLQVLRGGLNDPSPNVRFGALEASVAYLTQADATQLAQAAYEGFMSPMLETISLGGKFIQALLPLAASHPSLFADHLGALLRFLPGLILPKMDSGPTPTVARPFPFSQASNDNGSAPTTPPASSPERENDGEEEEETRQLALEFMITLSEAKPSMVKKVEGWVNVVVRACLEGMSEFEEEEGWEDEDPSNASTSSPSEVYEQALDRLALSLGGRTVLPIAFQIIPSLLVSYDWRGRHAGLMAIAAIAEGTGKVMVKEQELGKVVDLVSPLFRDSHPRVRYAACQCVGQLCTDLEEIIQEQYHNQLFGALIPALEDPVARVQTHASAALINFCEGVEHETFLPYVDPIVERLLGLLHSEKRYVQEQAVTSLAMVADASEGQFAKHYPSIFPLLLNVLQSTNEANGRLRIKAMECAGLIAIAVGKDVFRPDANAFVETLIRIQKTPSSASDPQLTHYLIATWAKVCQALGQEFEPYLGLVMPGLLSVANAKADVTVYDSPSDRASAEYSGWDTILMDGQIVGVRTAGIDEKCQAFETMVIYASTLRGKYGPYVAQSLEITLPQLRFYFHDGVREACAMLIPLLLSAGQQSSTLTPALVSATFHQLISCIGDEHDSSFLASLFKALTDSLVVIGGPSTLPAEYKDGIMDATKRQLQAMAERRRARGAKQTEDVEDNEDLALIEEMEDFALEDMGKMLRLFDPQHDLLVAVSSVKELGSGAKWDEDRE